MLPRVTLLSQAPALFLALSLSFSSGCGDESEPLDESPTGDLIKSDKQRVANPLVFPSEQSKQVKGNSALALDMYQKVQEKAGNIFFSPHSISVCLAMLHAGARNNTEAEMAKALAFMLPQAKLHPFFNWLDLALAARGKNAQASDGKAFRLNVVNATWGQKGYKFLTPFLDTLAMSYGAGLRLLKFATAPELSRKTINGWVEKKTEGRIKDLLPQGSITSYTKLVLSNAIYFNAAWLTPFETKNTKTGTFNLQGGSKVSVPIMKGSIPNATFTKGSGFQAVGLPYDGNELSMVLLVPDQGKMAAFEKGLTATVLDGILAKMSGVMANLSLPKFEIDYTLNLKQALKDLGMKDAFSTAADFSGINGNRDLYISGAFHKAFVKVNEAGTEAAAATAVVAGNTSAPPVINLTIDRPFLLLVRDHATGAVLFMGRVSDPS